MSSRGSVNALTKTCRNCSAPFSLTEKAQLYCVDCHMLLSCCDCGKRLNVHMTRVSSKPRRCMNCHVIHCANNRKPVQPTKINGFRKDSKIGKHFPEICELYSAGLSTNEIGKKFNVDGTNVFRALKSKGVALRSQKESLTNCVKMGKWPRLAGERSRFWRGGRCVHTGGYILIKQPGHHRTDCRGYVPEHVLVAEREIGRKLEKHEVVHHINRVRDDNRPENLQVMTIREHQQLHARENKINRLKSKKQA